MDHGVPRFAHSVGIHHRKLLKECLPPATRTLLYGSRARGQLLELRRQLLDRHRNATHSTESEVDELGEPRVPFRTELAKILLHARLVYQKKKGAGRRISV